MNIYFTKFVLLTVFSTVFFTGCVKSDSEKILEKTVNEIIVEKKNSNIVESENAYVKNDGWNVHEVKSSSEIFSSKIKLKDKSGIERDVEVWDYTGNIITDESYNFSNPDFGKIKILSYRKLHIGDKIFGYIINAQKTNHDETEKKDVGEEIVFPLNYFDKDGDGKFETLLKNSDEFFVPDWIL